MEELNAEFTNFMNEFKKTDVKTKREQFIDMLKEFIAMLEIVANNENVNVSLLKSNEILDLRSEEVSEDDFLEAAVVYLENAKNIIGEILEQKLYSDITQV